MRRFPMAAWATVAMLAASATAQDANDEARARDELRRAQLESERAKADDEARALEVTTEAVQRALATAQESIRAALERTREALGSVEVRRALESTEWQERLAEELARAGDAMSNSVPEGAMEEVREALERVSAGEWLARAQDLHPGGADARARVRRQARDAERARADSQRPNLEDRVRALEQRLGVDAGGRERSLEDRVRELELRAGSGPGPRGPAGAPQPMRPRSADGPAPSPGPMPPDVPEQRYRPAHPRYPRNAAPRVEVPDAPPVPLPPDAPSPPREEDGNAPREPWDPYAIPSQRDAGPDSVDRRREIETMMRRMREDMERMRVEMDRLRTELRRREEDREQLRGLGYIDGSGEGRER